MQNIGRYPLSDVSRFYQHVIDDVCTKTREIFRDEGVNEGTIQAFKKTWEEKVMSSKAVGNHQIQNQGVYMLEQGISAAPMLPRNGMTNQLIHSGAAQEAQPTLPEGVQFQPGDTKPQVAQVTRAGELDGNNQMVTSSNVSTSSTNKIIQLDGSDDCHVDFNIKNQVRPSNSMEKPKTNNLVKRTHRGKSLRKKNITIVFQFDGENDDDHNDSLFGDTGDISSSDDEEEDDHKNDKENGEVKDEPVKTEDEDLCSDDDLSSEEEDSEALFDIDNVIVCQSDKIHRTKSNWKFNLKLGIMNLNGIDHVFHKAVGEANW